MEGAAAPGGGGMSASSKPGSKRWKAYIEFSAKIAAQRDEALAEIERLDRAAASQGGPNDA